MSIIAQLFSHSVLALALFFFLLIGTAICTASVLNPSKNHLPPPTGNGHTSPPPPSVNNLTKPPPPVNYPSKISFPGSPSKRVSFGTNVVIPPHSYSSKENLTISPDLSFPLFKPFPQRATFSRPRNQYPVPSTSSCFPPFPSLDHSSERFEHGGSSFYPPPNLIRKGVPKGDLLNQPPL